MATGSRSTRRYPNPDQPTIAVGAGARRVGTTPRARTRGGAIPLTGTIRLPLIVGAVHLAIVQLTATLAYRYGSFNSPLSPPYSTMPPEVGGFWGHLVNPFRTWDGLWYRLVAVEGYDPSKIHKAAFWPLFPWTMRVVGDNLSLPYEVAGYLIANVSFVVALVLLYRLLMIDFDQRTSACTLWVIALFPTAFFFSAVYTEAPFLMLLVGSLLAGRQQRWWLAGGIGLLAALTRSYGAFLVLPLGLLFIQQHGFDLRRWVPRGLAVVLPLGGPLIFSRHLQGAQGNGRAWMDVQDAWNRYDARPWETLRYAFTDSPRAQAINPPQHDGAEWGWLRELVNEPRWGLITSKAWRASVANSDTLELACTLLFIGLTLIGLRRLPLYMTAYLVPGLIVPLFQPSSVHALMSMPRFGLTLFPLFVVIATLIEGRSIAKPLAVVSTVLLVLLTIQFTQWYWVS